MAETNTSGDAQGEELSDAQLESLYTQNRVVEEERKNMRLWAPQIPAACIPQEAEDMVLNTFKKKVRCIGYGEPYFSKVAEDGTYAGYAESDNIELFIKECSKTRIFECDNLRAMMPTLASYRKKLKALECRLVEMYAAEDKSAANRKICILIRDSVERIRRTAKRLQQFQTCLSTVSTKAEDMWFFLRKAYRISKKGNALPE